MKKLYVLIAALAITATANAQSQRLVLFEEFTGETCGPCAQVNPGLNAMLNANDTKVVSIKYQNDIPSPGPRFYAYNTGDITARQTYYANNYSPNGILDGNVFNDNAGVLDPTILNNRYIIPSPFTVRVEHTFSAANDTIYIMAVIKASQSYTGTTLVAQTVVTERDIFGYTSPNGENHYEGVMRKMLPTSAGTPLQAIWNAGDSVVLNLSWYITPAALSSPVFSQLSPVVFVQENSNKEVLQAGFSRAQVPLDPKAVALTNFNEAVCTGSVDPVIEIFNNGITPITSLDIQYKLDNGANSIYNWTGTLASFTSATAQLPNIVVAATGNHSVTATLINPNGGATDNNLLNNVKVRYFGVPVAAVAGSVAQDFALTTFPPASWIRINPDNGFTWQRATANAWVTGSGSAKMDFYSSPGGNIDNLYIYPVDMSLASGATLTFDVAHRMYDAVYVDRLDVEVSTDCGATWTAVYSKSGAALATVAGFLTSAFTPTVTQWRSETVAMGTYVGQSNVLIRFSGISGYGNNAYVDNVNLTVVTGITETELTNSISVYPNPAKGNVNINVNLKDNKSVNFTLTDLSGKEIMHQQAEGSVFTQTLDLKNVAAGTYMLNVTIDGKSTVKKVTVE